MSNEEHDMNLEGDQSELREPKVFEQPAWWREARKLWQEDDATVCDPSAEHLDKAWERLFRIKRSQEVLIEKVDLGDATLLRYYSGRIACTSYPGENEIRVGELPEASR